MKKSFWLPIALGLCGLSRAPDAGAVSAPVRSHRAEAARDRAAPSRRRACSPRRSSASPPASTGSRVRSRPPRSASTAPSRASTARRTSCSRCATGSRGRATASRACAASWPRRAGCSPPGSWRSTSRTRPDALTVVLESDGFGDLLERAEFLERISDQDREITDRVRGLRDQRPGPGGPAGQAGAARAAGRRAHPAASATRSPRPRTSSCRRATSSRRRAPTSAARWPRCASRSRTRWRTSPRCRPSRRAWPALCRASPRADQAGLAAS